MRNLWHGEVEQLALMSCSSVEKPNFKLRKPVLPNLLYDIIQQYFLKTLHVPDTVPGTEEHGDQNQVLVFVEFTQ